MAIPSPAISLADIAEFVQGRIEGDPARVIRGVASLQEAGPTDLSYIAQDRFLSQTRESRAAAFIVAHRFAEVPQPQIVVQNPAYAFARVVQQWFVPAYRARGIASDLVKGSEVRIGADASIWSSVTLGDRVTIGARVTLYPGVFIGEETEIGDDCVLYPNVVVRERCTIGRRVVIHSGTVIGSDGFGYVQHDGRHHKVPQIGGVVLEDDVELGANVTVDRATFGMTRIRRGTKVDNLVQIAHNVEIGEDTIVVAQVGIAGSTRVGSHVMIGGQAGLADHLQIADRVLIAARSGVNRSVTSDQIVSGAPAMPHEQALKAQALIPHLPEMRQRLRELQKRVETLERAGVVRTGRAKKVR
ncbi:UDP-3-O-acylglucosamine N-acyltransferase [Nitrospira tepida]|uniref:UDP-3-O-acylglucosamine N-acyltransferase n=1 Tax=Nitrospira tepida TaxID=2973512 RepID=A0AA86N0H0_9BACT|nr:UDP-3-O-(3-hydroxymyristoyl)glucosamine N-acyltransferase [Nitrospira tepida]CAI4032458.1 UDP-3-O-acylglucosamine N-acyltransferase [Nitrospira tepida]